MRLSQSTLDTLHTLLGESGVLTGGAIGAKYHSDPRGTGDTVPQLVLRPANTEQVSQIMAMIRLWIGPGTGDRILALDTMFINAIGLIVLLGLLQGTQIYFEAALIIAMLGFVSTVAYARFVLRGDIIE